MKAPSLEPLRITFEAPPNGPLVTPCALVGGPLHGCRLLVPRETPPELLVGLPIGTLARYKLAGWWEDRAQYRHVEDGRPPALRLQRM